MYLTYKAIPDRWISCMEILNEIGLGSPPIIAGGAIMSRLLPNYRAKDVDIFVGGVNQFEQKTLRHICESLHGEVKVIREPISERRDVEELASSGDGLRSSSNFHWIPTDYPDLLVDVILTEERFSSQSLMSSFDITLSQCSYSQGTFHLSPDFLQDVRDEVLRVVNPKPTSSERVKKYLKVFPGFTVIGHGL